MTPLETLLDAYRQASQSEREKGTYFEELIVCYLRNCQGVATHSTGKSISGFLGLLAGRSPAGRATPELRTR